MTPPTRIPPRSVFREKLAFSRAVEVQGVAHVSATGPTDAAGKLVAPDAYAQTVDVFRQIEAALGELGLTRADITRIRIYLIDYADLDDILRAQRPLFDATPPACSVLCVAGFHVDGMRVYIEADAVRPTAPLPDATEAGR